MNDKSLNFEDFDVGIVEAAKTLKVSHPTAYRLLRGLPFVQVGKGAGSVTGVPIWTDWSRPVSTLSNFLITIVVMTKE
ncbi:MAG: hypothetical protein R3E95_06805 [Thiolinea sp.]